MKKIAVVAVPSLFLALGLVFETIAHAGDPGAVKGTIKVAGVTAPGLSGLKCDDLEVVVSSKEMTSPPPGYTGLWLGGVPVWQRHARATGTWASGTCSYVVSSVPNTEFKVVLVPDVSQSCGGYYTLTSTPPQAGWFKIGADGTRVQDFTLNSILCIPIK